LGGRARHLVSAARRLPPKGEVARRDSVWREQDRALYVVDAGGVIRYSTVAPRLDFVPDLDELLEAVDHAQAIPT
jgi:alkyl hydroperoxide reductase subunit AhpC